MVSACIKTAKQSPVFQFYQLFAESGQANTTFQSGFHIRENQAIRAQVIVRTGKNNY